MSNQTQSIEVLETIQIGGGEATCGRGTHGF